MSPKQAAAADSAAVVGSLVATWRHECGKYREKLSDVILPVLRAGLNFEKSLPPAVRGSAGVPSARFRHAGVARFEIVFDGQMDVSDEQVSLMVRQLNQAAFAQGSPAK
jgi:hypothetical protein